MSLLCAHVDHPPTAPCCRSIEASNVDVRRAAPHARSEKLRAHRITAACDASAAADAVPAAVSVVSIVVVVIAYCHCVRSRRH